MIFICYLVGSGFFFIKFTLLSLVKGKYSYLIKYDIPKENKQRNVVKSFLMLLN